MSENERHSQTNVAINDESQGSVATHLRCGKTFNSNICTNLLLSLSVSEKNFLNRRTFDRIACKN